MKEKSFEVKRMQGELIPVQIAKIMQSPSYTLFILDAGTKKFPIYAAPNVGTYLQSHLTEQPKIRPHTHDLMDSFFKGLNVQLLHIVINDVQDTIYFARLFAQQEIGDKTHILEIDARPSDCLILAFAHKAPIYCTNEVLEKAISIDLG